MLESKYYGEDYTAIMPKNIKNCRQKNMINQMPKTVKDKIKIKKSLLLVQKLLEGRIDDENSYESFEDDIELGKTTKKKVFTS